MRAILRKSVMSLSREHCQKDRGHPHACVGANFEAWSVIRSRYIKHALTLRVGRYSTISINTSVYKIMHIVVMCMSTESMQICTSANDIGLISGRNHASNLCILYVC